MMSLREFPRGLLIALTATALALLVVVGVAVYGLVTGPDTTTPASGPRHDTPPASASATATTPPPTRRAPEPPVVPVSGDAETFARAVAGAVFDWDTASGLIPVDYTSAVLRAGDPTGTEQAGLAADLAAYLPSRQAWINLRSYATRQHLSIDRAYIPDAWADAQAQALPGQLPAGATAYTIDGVRHRDGTWNGQAVTATRDVSFTIFLTCPPPTSEPADRSSVANGTPAGGSCFVLRLSQLDKPLR